MDIYNIIVIPLLFGLIGFFEPCSLGINAVFLHRTESLNRGKRIRESLLFTLVRGLVLAFMGLSAAFFGSMFLKMQSSIFIAMGVIFIIAGVLNLINYFKPVFRQINLSRHFAGRSGIALGLIFGPIIPACAIPIVIALIGKSALTGVLIESFLSLFIFGIFLSIPLVFISYFERSNEIIVKISAKVENISWIAGILLIIIGILTMMSGSWWAGAS